VRAAGRLGQLCRLAATEITRAGLGAGQEVAQADVVDRVAQVAARAGAGREERAQPPPAQRPHRRLVGDAGEPGERADR